MTAFQKVSVSLLVAVVVLAGLTVWGFTGLFDYMETRFYNPAVTRDLTAKVAGDAGAAGALLKNLEQVFSGSLRDETVRRSFRADQSVEDILARSRLFGGLMEKIPGLLGVRFVDAGGRRIHYSTFSRDVIRQGEESVSYNNYDENMELFTYESLAVPAGGAVKITPDGAHSRLVFSFPFYDSFNAYRGAAFFYVSLEAITEELYRAGRLFTGEGAMLLTAPPGVILGMPGLSGQALAPLVASLWAEDIIVPRALDSADGSFTLISAKTQDGLLLGRLFREDLFKIPFAVKLILLGAVFCTVFLVMFLLFNLRQDPVTVIQSRLRQLQKKMFEEYYEKKAGIDWARWCSELELRREDVRNEVKRGLRLSKRKEQEKGIDELIDKAWSEFLSAWSAQQQPAHVPVSFDEEKLASLLERILAAAGEGERKVNRKWETGNGDALTVDAEADEVEELGEAVEVEEEPETLEEAEVLEEPEELEEAAEGEVMDLEPLADEVDELGELEITDEIEPLDEKDIPAKPPGSLLKIISDIEFSPMAAADDDDLFEMPQVYSPIDLLSKKWFGDDDSRRNEHIYELESLQDKCPPVLVSRLFDVGKTLIPEVLEVVGEPGEEAALAVNLIEEIDGINYVNRNKIPQAAEEVDTELKTLVDSVLK